MNMDVAQVCIAAAFRQSRDANMSAPVAGPWRVDTSY